MKIHLWAWRCMQKVSSQSVDRELENLRAYLRSSSPSRRLTAERLSRLAALVLGRNEMSYAEALEALEFPPGSRPTADEVRRTFGQLSLKAHPDRGGNEEAFKYLNNAKDVLMSEPADTSLEDVDEDRTARAGMEALHAAMKPMGKKPHWWVPSHNFVLNQALFGWNGWYFTVLPMWADKKGYRPAKNGRPEGIVLHPAWHFAKGAEWGEMSPDLVERIVGIAKKQKEIKASVKEEIKWLETKFSIKVPDAVEAKIVANSEKVAIRRIDVNRLRVKDELWPFDGSKPIPLGSFD